MEKIKMKKISRVDVIVNESSKLMQKVNADLRKSDSSDDINIVKRNTIAKGKYESDESDESDESEESSE